MTVYKIPRIVLAAPQSSSGKTTVVIGVLRVLREKGLKVQPFKIGPDYIDPSYHTIAAGQPGHNLDTWLLPQEKMQQLFINAAKDADIAIIEGVMGLYDGGRNGVSSTAEIAKRLQAPVVLVINCRSMGDSAAALALGFKTYDKEINFAGVILNCLGSPTHEQMIREALQKIDIKVFGAIRRDENMQMPERHLGLKPALAKETEEKISYIAQCVNTQTNFDALLSTAQSAAPLPAAVRQMTAGARSKVTIAVARDEAFSFYYAAGLDVLKNLGAKIIYFSPLHDKALPDCDAAFLGGGFPELFAKELSENTSMHETLREAAKNKMPIYTECGGYMYLMQEITDFADNTYPMAGIVPAKAVMQRRLQMVGYVTAQALSDNLLLKQGGTVRGHEFHFSVQESTADFPWAFTFTKNRNNASYKAGYAKDNILGSYLHLHFLGAISCAKRFVEQAYNYQRSKNK